MIFTYIHFFHSHCFLTFHLFFRTRRRVQLQYLHPPAGGVADKRKFPKQDSPFQSLERLLQYLSIDVLFA